MKIQFSIATDDLKSFLDGKEVSYYGINQTVYGQVHIECEHTEIEVLKQTSNPTIRRYSYTRNLGKLSW